VDRISSMAKTTPANSPDLSAIILAAGRSRRMGAFKPLLPFGETTVIESCLRNFRAAQVNDLVVVVGHRGEEIRQFLKDTDVRFATNPDPEGPMAASIALGTTEVKPAAPAILITPVDHPAVEVETITLIIDAWRRGAKLIQPEYRGRGGHPVLIDAGYRQELLHLDPNNGLRGFFLAHRDEVLRLPLESPHVARDMDTWEDYVALHEQVFGRAPRKI
jgi:molybdenum cofactor cytidylyltransferase